MSGKALEASLRPPRGPIAAKYELFRWAGEPGWPSAYQEIWAIGDVGTGKTSSLIDSIFFSIYFYPGARVAVMRSTLVELQGALIPDLKDRLSAMFESGFLEYVRDLNIVRAANGSEIHFFGLDTADNKLWGQQWFRAFVDQGERISAERLDLLHTRIRQQVKHKDTKALGRTYVKLTANWDRGRDWVYKRIYDGATQIDRAGDILEKVVRKSVGGKVLESRILSIFSRTTENHELTEDYFRHLILSGKLMERAMRGGYDRGGDDHLVFPEYSQKHITDIHPDVEGRPIFVGLDHGVWHPTVALFFVKGYDGTIMPVREYIRRNASAVHNAESIADIIYALSEMGADSFHVYADPSMWARNAMDADLASVASVYEATFASMDIPIYMAPAFGKRKELKDVPVGQGGKGVIEYGISAIKELLRQHRLIVNPKLTPKVDEVLAELTRDDIVNDTMIKVDVFDAMRYAIANVRMDDMGYMEHRVPKSAPFTIRRDFGGGEL